MTTVDHAVGGVPATKPPVDRARRQRRRELLDRVVIGTLIVAAAIFSIWPVAATYNNNYKAWEFSQSANKQAQAVPEEVASESLLSAYSYNSNLANVELMDPIGQTPLDSPEYQDYLSQLSNGTAMGTLRLPTIKSQMPIFHGTSDEVLNKGAGHMFGTTLPVGGAGNHAGIAAHRGLPTMTAFDNLPDMKMDDLFFIDVLGKTMAYKVTDIQTVLPHEVDAIQRLDRRDMVTLVTCTPYGINSHRLLVTGDRVPWSAEQAAAADTNVPFDWSVQDWMWMRVIVAGVAAALLLLLLAWWGSKDIRLLAARRRASRVVPDAAPEPA